MARLLTLDADKDGKLSKEEVHDSRLQALFKRADSNQDGSVTKEELTKLHAAEASSSQSRGPGGRGPGGPPQRPEPGGRTRPDDRPPEKN